MKEILNFLIEVNKLKEMPRTGLLWLGVKNPSTVAEHTFQATLAVWLLGEKRNINLERTFKAILSHDLCEVYGGDATPFWGLLPKKEAERKKFLKKWIRIPLKEKEERRKKRFEAEKTCLFKLINPLRPELKKEIFSSWINYERGVSPEGRFCKQVDQIAGMIEALETLGIKKRGWVTPWWEESEELIDDSLLQKFLKTIQKKFYNQKPKNYKRDKDLESTLDFILEIGKLKKMSRLYWIMRKVNVPETVAGHIFTLTIIAWVFGKEKKFKMEKLFKMALAHELSAAYTGDTTPYDKILPANRKDRHQILQKMVRLPQREKKKIFLKDYREEKKALEKLTRKLRPALRKEIIQLWNEYRTRSSPEGCFLSQLNVAAVLLQGLLYEKRDKNFSAAPLWEWAFEVSDDPKILKLLEEMKNKFYPD